tara:strand:+ start:236 stop:472 length:237 start_codon:yes stop_codon:yes gene_type:complete
METSSGEIDSIQFNNVSWQSTMGEDHIVLKPAGFDDSQWNNVTDYSVSDRLFGSSYIGLWDNLDSLKGTKKSEVTIFS